MSLHFLTIQQAIDEYLTTDYFDQMNDGEVIFRLNNMNLPVTSLTNLNQHLRHVYTTFPLEFSEYEKSVLRFYFKHLVELLKNKSPSLMPDKKPIGLIKLCKGVDWEWPYTINHSIVLSVSFIDSLVSCYQLIQSTRETKTNLINSKNTILLHELLHIIQRNQTLYPQHNLLFNHIYTQIWGFTKIPKSHGFKEKSHFNAITNPDGYNFEWAIPIYNHLYLPLLSRSLDNKLVGILVGGNQWDLIDNVPKYQEKFYGLKKQLYHPNEILAHLVSDYIVNGQILTANGAVSVSNYYNFYQLLNKYLIPFKNK